MKKLQLILFLLITNFLFSQIVFEPGFYIDKTGSRHEGLIKNYQWKNNPEEIEFKENEKSAVKKVSENEISEFSVGDEKYIGAKVLVDRSSSNISNLSTDKDFNLEEDFILLKLIVFGDAELYQSFDGGGNKFFYKKKGDAQLQYLKFKEYLVNNSAIKKNEEYKIQLKNLFADNPSITQNEIDRLPYRYRGMRDIFEKYSNIKNTETVQKGKNFNIYIKPGVGFSKYSVSSDEYDITGGDYKKSGISLRLGLELEYVLNFNKRKWAIISELAFQKTEIKIPDYNRRVFEGKYTSIQVPLGIKHSMFINPYFKIFVTASMNADILLDSKVFYIDNIPQEKRSAVISPIYSLGTNYKNFGFEAKLGANPSFFSSYYGQFNSIGLGNIAFALSYKIK